MVDDFKTLTEMNNRALEIRCSQCKELLGYAIELKGMWYCDVRCGKEECMRDVQKNGN